MPFRRAYRRNYKRSKLSKSYIYANRGAKAQSKQIAALNRKVNYLARANRPEILIKYKNFDNTFTNATFNSNFFYEGIHPWSASYSGDDFADGDNLEGNFCRAKGFSLKLVSQYSDNWRESIADASHDASAGYRIVILQFKRATNIGGNDSFGVSSLFNNTTTLSSSDSNLTMPLIQGISSTYKILYSKAFTISRYHSTRLHNIYIPASKMLNYVTDINIQDATSQVPRGYVIVAFLTGGLHADIDYTSQIHIEGTMKLAYTDN